MEGRYNVRSPAVKRLMKEAQELSEPTDQYYAQPLEDNLFEWHFTVRGPADSDFQNGIYHGRIILPVDYPMKPPSIIWLTPNGRFETNKKICLSISGHHPESWQPSWSIRTALLAIIGFMPTHPGGAIGSLDYKPDERKVLAKKSRLWKCPACDDISNILLEPNAESQTMSKEAQELAAQIQFQGEKPKGQAKSATDSDDTQYKKKDGDPKPETATGATPATPTQGELPTSSHQNPQTVPATSSTTLSSELTNNNGGVMPATSTFNNIGYPAYSAPASSPSMFHAPPLWGGGPPVYCGQTSPYGLLSTPRFPYPPSYYPSPSFYPPGYAMPPGMGMVPCPFPPPYQPMSSGNSAPPSTVSINNSSVPNSNPCKRPDCTSVTYTRSPMSCSTSVMCRSRNGDATGESSAPSTYQPDDADKAERKVVLGELLNKVKRVGSDESQGGADVDNELDQATKLGKQEFQSDQISTNVDGEIPVREGRPDIDASAPLNRRVSCGDVTISEAALPSDMENSEADAPPMEVSDSEQRSFLDKSKTCNSTSELEKCKAKHPPSKTLRQRQSATASVVTEAADESQADPSVTASGQRIEAESGDSGGPRMRPRPRTGGLRLIHPLPPRDGAQRNAQSGRSPYDFTVLLMVVCLLTIVGILFNRLFGMYTAADIPTSSPSV